MNETPIWRRPFTPEELTQECRRLAAIGWHVADIAGALLIDPEVVQSAMPAAKPKRVPKVDGP